MFFAQVCSGGAAFPFAIAIIFEWSSTVGPLFISSVFFRRSDFFTTR